MTKIETMKILALLASAYPKYYNDFDKEEALHIVNFWNEIFMEDNVNDVEKAVKELITTNHAYPPDIATIKNKIKDIKLYKLDNQSDEELWNTLKAAVCNIKEIYQREFDKMPERLQNAIETPLNLMKLSSIFKV